MQGKNDIIEYLFRNGKISAENRQDIYRYYTYLDNHEQVIYL